MDSIGLRECVHRASLQSVRSSDCRVDPFHAFPQCELSQTAVGHGSFFSIQPMKINLSNAEQIRNKKVSSTANRSCVSIRVEKKLARADGLVGRVEFCCLVSVV